MKKLNIIIRKANTNDIESVVNLLEQEDMLHQPEVDGNEALYRVLSTHNAKWFVAEDENKDIIGSIRGSWNGSRAFIHQLVIRKNKRHLGVGCCLVEAIIDHFRNIGAPTVAVTVTENSAEFFEKMGFNRTNVFLMIRSL